MLRLNLTFKFLLLSFILLIISRPISFRGPSFFLFTFLLFAVFTCLVSYEHISLNFVFLILAFPSFSQIFLKLSLSETSILLLNFDIFTGCHYSRAELFLRSVQKAQDHTKHLEQMHNKIDSFLPF